MFRKVFSPLNIKVVMPAPPASNGDTGAFCLPAGADLEAFERGGQLRQPRLDGRDAAFDGALRLQQRLDAGGVKRRDGATAAEAVVQQEHASDITEAEE